MRLVDVKEVLLKPFPCAEVWSLVAVRLFWLLLQKFHVESMLSNEVCQLLNLLLWPLLDTLQVLPLVPIVEILNRLFKLNLSRAKWMDLHELLQIEEGLRDRKLVTAPTRCKEWLELFPCRQFEDYLVDLTQWNRINKLVVFSIKDRLHKELSYSLHIAVLEL